ncbi:MAG: SGNH/GDSL hydrolase family protein [Deltaproteobacteria bacterium]|nr:SGNH/GDSL hydrolase family protein [Deltaproteobacteria bacterium]
MKGIHISSGSSFLHGWKPKVILVLFSVMLSLIAAEIILNYTVFAYQKLITPNSADKNLYYEILANRKNYWETNEGKKYLVRSNNVGMRGPDIKIPKPKGLKRIVLVGDSMIFGAGLEEKDTISSKLQDGMNAVLGPGRVEVVNGGVCGYNALQESNFILEKVLPLDPDLVIWVYYINDLEELDYQPEIVETCKVDYSTWEWLDSKFRRYSKLYRLIFHESNTSFNIREKLDPAKLPQRCYRASVQRVVNGLHALHIKLVLAFLPYFSWPGRDSFRSPDLSIPVKTEAKRYNLPYLDFRNAFMGRRASELYISRQDKHCNETSTTLIADQIERFLLDGRYLTNQ